MRNMEPDNLKTNFKNKKNGLVSVLIILMVKYIIYIIRQKQFSIKRRSYIKERIGAFYGKCQQ